MSLVICAWMLLWGLWSYGWWCHLLSSPPFGGPYTQLCSSCHTRQPCSRKDALHHSPVQCCWGFCRTSQSSWVSSGCIGAFGQFWPQSPPAWTRWGYLWQTQWGTWSRRLSPLYVYWVCGFILRYCLSRKKACLVRSLCLFSFLVTVLFLFWDTESQERRSGLVRSLCLFSFLVRVMFLFWDTASNRKGSLGYLWILLSNKFGT